MEEFVRHLEEAAELCRKYGLPSEELDHDVARVQNYRVSVAVLGAFNTGKSALVNALLGTCLVQVSLSEETVVPVEIFYGTQGVSVLRDGFFCRSDPAVLRTGGHALEGAQMARASLSLSSLAGLPDLCLLDTPGIGTPQAARSAHMLERVR